jgi:hypothetical protein
MPDIKWTPSLIEERFVEAADVMKRLPNVRVPGHFNTWPKMLLEFADLVGQEPPRLRRPPPAPDDGSSLAEKPYAGGRGPGLRYRQPRNLSYHPARLPLPSAPVCLGKPRKMGLFEPRGQYGAVHRREGCSEFCSACAR